MKFSLKLKNQDLIKNLELLQIAATQEHGVIEPKIFTNKKNLKLEIKEELKSCTAF